MKILPQAIALASLVASATALEIYGKDADGLWVIVFIWVFFGDWQEKK